MIRSQALDRDVPEIADMAETLANMFRYNIGQPQSLATFEQELENVKNYFLIPVSYTHLDVYKRQERISGN